MRRKSGSSNGGAPRSRRGRMLLPSLEMLAALARSVAAYVARAQAGSAPVLVVDNSFALDTSDPGRAFDPASVLIDRAIHDTLFTYRGSDLTHPVPLLVRSWKSKGDKTLIPTPLLPPLLPQ